MIVFMAFLRAQSNIIGICNLPLFRPISFGTAEICHLKKFTTQYMRHPFLCPYRAKASHFELMNQTGKKISNISVR